MARSRVKVSNVVEKAEAEHEAKRTAETLRRKVFERIKAEPGQPVDVDKLAGTVRKMMQDRRTYNLSTAEGRGVWRDAAGDGLERVVFEDGLEWLTRYAQERVDVAVRGMVAAGAIVERPYRVEINPMLREVVWNIEDEPKD